jgi:AcrR family transcriptional regulator
MPRAIEHAKADILGTTRRLMAEQGYAHLNMRAVAAECGIATGTLYNYYPSKDDIVYAVMLEDWEILLTELDARSSAAIDGADDMAELRRIYEALRGYIATYREVWMAMAAIPEAAKPAVLRRYDATIFVRQLGSRVAKALPRGGAVSLDPEMLQDLVVRTFSTYAMLDGFDFARLEPILRKLVS